MPDPNPLLCMSFNKIWLHYTIDSTWNTLLTCLCFTVLFNIFCPCRSNVTLSRCPRSYVHLAKRRPQSVLTLSYQQRKLSCPHMQILVEQSSLQTQYCWWQISRASIIGNLPVLAHKATVSLRQLMKRFLTDLQVCYVPIDVHGGGDTVFGDVFVAVWIGFTVNRVDTGDRNSLLPQSYVAVNTADAD